MWPPTGGMRCSAGPRRAGPGPARPGRRGPTRVLRAGEGALLPAGMTSRWRRRARAPAGWALMPPAKMPPRTPSYVPVRTPAHRSWSVIPAVQHRGGAGERLTPARRAAPRCPTVAGPPRTGRRRDHLVRPVRSRPPHPSGRCGGAEPMPAAPLCAGRTPGRFPAPDRPAPTRPRGGPCGTRIDSADGRALWNSDP